jgi:hypothetical protein
VNITAFFNVTPCGVSFFYQLLIGKSFLKLEGSTGPFEIFGVFLQDFTASHLTSELIFMKQVMSWQWWMSPSSSLPVYHYYSAFIFSAGDFFSLIMEAENTFTFLTTTNQATRHHSRKISQSFCVSTIFK